MAETDLDLTITVDVNPRVIMEMGFHRARLLGALYDSRRVLARAETALRFIRQAAPGFDTHLALSHDVLNTRQAVDTTLRRDAGYPLKKVMQKPDGCYPACIATMTGIPLDEIPHPLPEEMAKEKWHTYANRVHAFLWSQHLFRLWMPRLHPPFGLSIAHGTSPRDVGHTCVADNGTIIHDPHPEGGGLVAIEGYEILFPFVVKD